MASRLLPSRRIRRLLALSAAWALPAAGLVVLTTSSSSSALPTQCVTSGGVNVVCTFTGSAGFGSPAIDIPAGTTSVTIHAVGRRGGNASNGTPGGNPAVIDAVIPTNGGERWFVNLRNDGGVAGTSSSGGSGGRGGGSSTVRVSTTSSPFLQAAGGGGAGNAGPGAPGTTSAGGNAGAAGAAGATTGTATASQGGQPATATAGGSGGLGGTYSNCTTTVQLPNGSDGVASTNTVGGGAGANGAYGGGGGGGGRFGGGGGAPGASSGCGGTFASGGGGGSSIVPDGATFGVSTTESAVVTLSFSLAPRADVSADSLAFGNVLVGTNSTEQTVTIGNSGSIPLTLGSGTMTGTDPASFVKTVDSCSNATLDVGATCQVTVLFKPTTTGTKTAVFRIADNSPTSPHDIALSGTGIAPVATLTKTSIDFGDRLVGTTSTSTVVFVRNTGAGALVIGTPTIGGTNAGDFVFGPGGTCAGASLAANATCQILLRFAPTATGGRTATVTIPTNAADSPSTITLAGNGIAPQAGVTPTSIDFGVETVGTATGSQVVTLANQGTADMHVSGLSLSGADPADFTTSADTCTGATVAPSTSCTVSVSFTPTATGDRAASLAFATDSAVPAVVALSGIGIPPADLKILATGSVYAGRDHLVTGTVDAPGDQMVYKLGVLNEDSAAHSFRIRLTQSGSPATAEVWSSGFGAKALPTDGSGSFVTPSIGAKKVLLLTLRVTPTAPGQTISSVDADLLTDNGLLIEGVRTETNTAAPVSGTSSFDLFAKQGTQPYVGGPVDGQTMTAPALNVGQTANFTLRLKNDGSTAQQIGLKVTDVDGCAGSFTVAVKVGTKVWTTEAFAGTYLTPSLAPGKVTQATVTVKRTAAGCPSKTLRVQSLDHGAVVGTSYLLANAAYNATTD